MPIQTYEYRDLDSEILMLERGPDSIQRSKQECGNIIYTIIDDCLIGTDRMRELMWNSASSGGMNSDGVLANMISSASYLMNYLPRKPKEDLNDYAARVQICTMTQYLGNTIDALVGMAMQKNPTIDPQMEENDSRWAFFDNVDLEGSNIRELEKKALEEALKYGMGFLYASTTSTGSDSTIATDRGRAFISVISPKAIKEFATENIDGIERVIWCKVCVCDDEHKEFWADGSWAVKKEDAIISSGKADAIGIPLFPFYTKQTGKWKAQPPFKELAFSQIRDMQKQSALDHGEAFTCFAPFFGSGIEKDDIKNQSFGPSRLIYVPNPSAKVQQMPINADGLEQARKGIEDNRSRIFTEGISFVVSESGVQKTAEQDRNDRSVEQGKLTNTVISIETALNHALTFVGQLSGDQRLADTVVSLNKEFNIQPMTPQRIAEIRNLWRDGAIDHKTALQELIRGGVVQTDKTSEDMLADRSREDLSDIGTGD